MTEKHDKQEIVTLKGLAITEDGKLTKHGYFEFLKVNLDDYSDLEFSPDEARKISNHLRRLSTGSAAMTPMYCAGSLCPFADRCPLQKMGKAPIGKQCHPNGTLVMTTEGYVPIEKLNPEKDKIVSYNTSCGLFRKNGRSFQVGTRHYKGNMLSFTTETASYDCTHDHIAMASWNKKAENLFVVYLMQKGNFFRIGKAKLFRQTGNKRYSGLTNRAQQEQCDKIWILGTYETNTEALLQEEYFSVMWQIPKACFIDRPCYKKTKKQKGLYKWVTQDQLDKHHRAMMKPPCYYAKLLDEHGLDIDYPIWDRSADYRQIGSIGKTFEIRACNVLEKYMDMIRFDQDLYDFSKGRPEVENRGTKEQVIQKFASEFDGLVYSLDVEKEHTYVVSGLVTHNCLIEVQLMRDWIIKYVDEYGVDPNNFTEVAYVNELAEIEILLMRLNMNLAKADNASLIIDQEVNRAADGSPIVQKDVSPFMELKDRLQNRRSKIIKLMVGDRQEKYKKEAALKVKLETDPSSQMARMRKKIEELSRQLDNVSSNIVNTEQENVVRPEDLIGG